MNTNVRFIRFAGAGALRTLAVSLLAVFWLARAEPAAAAKVQYHFTGWNGPKVRVYVTRPLDLSADRPVVFVMHGVERNAREYRDQWHELAIEHNFLLVVPELSNDGFSGPDAYSLGDMSDSKGARRDPGSWSFALLEPLFDDVKKRFSLKATSYALYGHSAGARFVQRFLLYVPDARVGRAVAANAGWYTMPDFDVGYPYGLAGSGVGTSELARALQRPLTVLLGDSDTTLEDPDLRKTAEAMIQGGNRLERGVRFFETGRGAAERLGVPFGWRLETVQGADHDNRLMAPAAIPFLLP